MVYICFIDRTPLANPRSSGKLWCKKPNIVADRPATLSAMHLWHSSLFDPSQKNKQTNELTYTEQTLCLKNKVTYICEVYEETVQCQKTLQDAFCPIKEEEDGKKRLRIVLSPGFSAGKISSRFDLGTRQNQSCLVSPAEERSRKDCSPGGEGTACQGRVQHFCVVCKDDRAQGTLKEECPEDTLFCSACGQNPGSLQIEEIHPWVAACKCGDSLPSQEGEGLQLEQTPSNPLQCEHCVRRTVSWNRSRACCRRRPGPSSTF
jgi:hypothetical protein